MKIKKQNEQRLVIVPTIGDLLYGNNRLWTTFLFFSIAVAVFVPQKSIPITLAVVFILLLLGVIAGQRVIIDKSSESIEFRKRYFMLVPRRRRMSFSYVRTVYVEHRTHGGGPMESSGWEVSIENIKIGQFSNKSKSINVANTIARMISAQMVEKDEEYEAQKIAENHILKNRLKPRNK